MNIRSTFLFVRNVLELLLSLVFRRLIPSTPFNIQIDLPCSCSYGCIFCDEGNNYSELNTDEAIFDRVAQAVDMKPSYISLVGSGETLQYSKLKELITFITLRSKHSCKIIIITTGYLLKISDINFYRKNSVQFLISMHGTNKRTWEKVCRPPLNASFNEIMSVIREYSQELSVMINHVINKKNFHELEDLYELLIKTGVRRLNLTPVLIHKNVQLNCEEEMSAIACLKRLCHRFEKEGIKVDSNIESYCVMMKTYHKDKSEFFREYSCSVGKIYMKILPTGDVISCCLDRSRGNLKDRSLKSIWKYGLRPFRDECYQSRTGIEGIDCGLCPWNRINYEIGGFRKKLLRQKRSD